MPWYSERRREKMLDQGCGEVDIETRRNSLEVQPSAGLAVRCGGVWIGRSLSVLYRMLPWEPVDDSLLRTLGRRCISVNAEAFPWFKLSIASLSRAAAADILAEAERFESVSLGEDASEVGGM